MVVNKPAGLVVHPGHGNYHGTLVNAIAWHMKDNPDYDANDPHVGLVHRIDKDTSGLLVVAKDDATHIGLSQQMAVHSVERAYQTVVYGGFDARDRGLCGSKPRPQQDRTAKKWRSTRQMSPTPSMPTPAIRYWSASAASPCWNAASRRAAPIRSASTWRPSSIPWRATRCMARTIASPACTASACTPKRLALCTRSPANICGSIRNCRNTSLIFLQRSGGERYEPSFFNACTV